MEFYLLQLFVKKKVFTKFFNYSHPSTIYLELNNYLSLTVLIKYGILGLLGTNILYIVNNKLK